MNGCSEDPRGSGGPSESHGWRQRLGRVTRQGRRFAVCGAGSAAVDFLIYTVLARGGGLHPLLANLFSRPAGGMVGFFANKYWTFAEHGCAAGHVQFARFWVLWFVNLVLSEFLIGILHDWMGIGPLLTKLLAELAISLTSFVCHRYWTFR